MNESNRASKLIGVYNPSTPSKNAPDRYIELDDAIEIVKKRDGLFINRNRAIRLERPPQDPPSNWETTVARRFDRRGISAQPNEELSIRYANAGSSGRDPEAREAVHCWPRLPKEVDPRDAGA